MDLFKFKFKRKTQNKESAIKKPKEKMDWTAAIAGFVSVIVVCGIVGVIGMIVIFGNMLKDKPELNIDDFQSSESSVVYDRNGEVIAELGATIRENVTYDDLPNNVIDAFVAVEDSRFFEHNGFDLPRFTKAILENIKSLSFSQGGSTFTMQLVKNTYFTNDSTGTSASRSGLSGVTRKVQEIALAMELENMISKEDILTLYLNRLNYGGSGQNIRGIQKASYYYFGKPVTEVNLSEAAFLAGVVNAPNAYNPYYHLEAATKRRNVVLYLMYQHGYISETEYNVALNVKLEDSLVSSSASKRGGGYVTKYQAYIDQVVNEVYELTGLDPYTTTMEIYTYMDQDVQTVMDNIQKGEVNDYYEFPDDNFELASIATNIQTGEIVGILGGRNYASGGALLLNHATEQFKQPGSSIKPILDYILAFEYLGWATDHVLVDKPINYVGTDIVIGNSDGKYRGQVTLSDCIGYSLNTTALQTLQQVVNKIGVSKVIEYMNSIGYTQAKAENFNVQWGIGGGEFYVSCEQMASAMGMILNSGTYYTPHTIKKIVFASGKEPVEPVYVGTQAISAEASYLMSKLLYNNVNGGYANLMYILKESDYAVYGKTGTTDWGNSGRDYGIPDGEIKDGWCVAGTSDFCVATWVGYEKAIKGEPSYMTLQDYLKCIKEKTTNLILDETVEVFGKPKESMTRPSGISDITHIISVYPYVSPIEGMSDQYISTGEIISKYATLSSPDSVSVESLSDTCKVDVSTNLDTVTLTWPKYPNEDKLKIASDTIDISLKDEEEEIDKEATGRLMFDYSWVYGAVKYKADVNVYNATAVFDADGKTSAEPVKTLSVSSGQETYSTKDLVLSPGYKIQVRFYYGYEYKAINSNAITVLTEIEDRDIDITMPSSTDLSSLDNMKAWAKKYGIPEANVVSKSEDSGHSIGTAVIKSDGTEITGTSFKVKMSKLNKVEVTYYVAKNPSVKANAISDIAIVTGGTTGTLTVIVKDATNPKLTISIDNATGPVIKDHAYGIQFACSSDTNAFEIQVPDTTAVGEYKFTITLKCDESATPITTTVSFNVTN